MVGLQGHSIHQQGRRYLGSRLQQHHVDFLTSQHFGILSAFLVGDGRDTMQGEGRGLIGPRFRKVLNVVLYSFVSIQFVVLLLAICETSRVHQLQFETYTLPALYLFPLVFDLGFRRYIRNALKQSLLTGRVAYVCNDFLSLLMVSVYGILLEFRWMR